MLEIKAKKWFKQCLIIWISILLFIAVTVWIVDPYFHFHKPFSFMSYRLYEERYINDGISRNFDFDAVITGTSMTQNFKPSEADELFGVTSVKEPFSGASFRELSENLDRMLARKPDVKMVIRCIDYNNLFRDADYQAYSEYPTYLYDENHLNDVEYIYNRDVLYHGVLANILMTLKKEPSTTMDEYAAWEKETGLEYVMTSYDRYDISNYREDTYLTDEEKEMVRANIEKNLVNLAKKYPDTIFYLYYSPYSICYWDLLKQENRMEVQFEMEKIATELMLECENIRLYNFFDNYEIITDLDNYRDKEHYSADINSMILQWIKDNRGLVTKENYQKRLDKEAEYYRNYDYESIFK